MLRVSVHYCCLVTLASASLPPALRCPSSLLCMPSVPCTSHSTQITPQSFHTTNSPRLRRPSPHLQARTPSTLPTTASLQIKQDTQNLQTFPYHKLPPRLRRPSLPSRWHMLFTLRAPSNHLKVTQPSHTKHPHPFPHHKVTQNTKSHTLRRPSPPPPTQACTCCPPAHTHIETAPHRLAHMTFPSRVCIQPT